MDPLEERQLRPVYAALETNSLKNALQHCNKLLKKRPNWDVVKALKAIALQRGLKTEEAAALCDEVLKSKPTDENTLIALNHTLRPLGRFQDIVTLYDNAFKQHPDNEEIGAQAFLAMIKVRSWKTAQQVGLKLWKSVKHERYLYWYLTSVVQQAADPETPEAMRKVLLKVAERYLATAERPSWLMIDRFYLHISVLLGLDDLDAARQLITSEKGEELCRNSLALEEMRAQIAKKVGDVEGERKRALQKIENGDNNWATYLALLDNTFPPSSESSKDVSLANGHAPSDALDTALPLSQKVEDLQTLFAKLMEAVGRKERAPSLASLELERRARQHGIRRGTVPWNYSEKRTARVYLEKFSEKPCCFDDLKPYVEAMEDGELAEWAEHLRSWTPDVSTAQALDATLNIQKLLRYRQPTDKAPKTVEELSAQAFSYLPLYFAALPLGKNLPTTELQPADDLAMLAAETLVSAWKVDGQVKYLLQAACVLEYALERSEKAYQFRLLLVCIYRLLGASSLCLDHYRAAGIRTVQSDTLSFLVLNRSSTFSTAAAGDLSYLTECVDASTIYSDNWTETGEMITKAFTYEKYSQIADFLNFEEMIENSLQRDLIRVEHLRMSLTHEQLNNVDILGIPQEIQDLEKNMHRKLNPDNRDYTVIPNFQPMGEDIMSQIAFGPKCGIAWVTAFSKCYLRALKSLSNLYNPLEDVASEVSGNEEFTSAESSLVAFSDALVTWLAPLGPSSPPSASTPTPSGNTNGHTAVESSKEPSSPPEPSREAALEAGKRVAQFFEDKLAEFRTVVETHTLPWEVPHVVSIALDGFVLLDISAFPYRTSTARVKKGDAVFNSVKPIRTRAVEVLREISVEVARLSNDVGSAPRLAEFESACEPLVSSSDFKPDFVHRVGKKVLESRKRLLEGVGKGIQRRAV